MLRVNPLTSSGCNEVRSKFWFGLHGLAAYQVKHSAILWSHLLALLSGKFVFDAAQNSKVEEVIREEIN